MTKNMIDELIKVLQRVKRADKIYMNLLKARDNLLFKTEINKIDEKWIRHVHQLICDSIEMIEKEEE